MIKQTNILDKMREQITERGLMLFDNISRMPIFEKPYTSPFIVISISHRGWMKANYDMKLVEFRPHDFTMVPPGHILYAKELSEDYLASLLVISPLLIEKLSHNNHLFTISPLEYQYNTTFHLSDEQYEGMLGNFKMLNCISQLNHPDRDELLANQMEIGTQLMEIYLQEKGIVSTQEFNSPQRLLNRFLNAIVKHFRESKEVQYYADLLCLSPKYFGSVIKESTGISASSWISRYVIVQAKSLLRYNKHLSIQQISYQLGFQDPAAFTRYFKANAGLSPKEYRAQQ